MSIQNRAITNISIRLKSTTSIGYKPRNSISQISRKAARQLSIATRRHKWNIDQLHGIRYSLRYKPLSRKAHKLCDRAISNSRWRNNWEGYCAEYTNKF